MGQSKVAPLRKRWSMASMESGVRARISANTRVLEHPHPVLSSPSYDVDPSDPGTVQLAAVLIGTMRANPGCVGISAPQLGHSVRLICIDVKGHAEARSCAGLVVLTNPEILAVSGSTVMREGCASVPGFTADIARASHVVVSGMVPGSGRRTILHSDAIEARSLLHALDHLDGILFVDRVVNPLTDLHARKTAI